MGDPRAEGEATHGRHGDGRPITVMVVDDHPMWRDAVARDLPRRRVRRGRHGGDGAAAVRGRAAARPDVVVLGPAPARDRYGVECHRPPRPRRRTPGCWCCRPSASTTDVLDAVKAGATGYLVKSASAEELLDAVRRTAAGRAGLHPGARRAGARRVPPAADGPGPSGPAAPQLTDRETEVLRLVAKGLSTKQIADRLALSHRTVQNHVQNTLRKLQLHNRVELVRYAIEQGLTTSSAHPSYG